MLIGRRWAYTGTSDARTHLRTHEPASSPPVPLTFSSGAASASTDSSQGSADCDSPGPRRVWDPAPAPALPPGRPSPASSLLRASSAFCGQSKHAARS